MGVSSLFYLQSALLGLTHRTEQESFHAEPAQSDQWMLRTRSMQISKWNNNSLQQVEAEGYCALNQLPGAQMRATHRSLRPGHAPPMQDVLRQIAIAFADGT
jgi:hypothetical protein